MYKKIEFFKRSGFKIAFIFMTTLFFFSCSPNLSKYSKYNYIKKDIIFTVDNDSLKLEFQTNGDYEFYFKSKNKKSPYYLKKELKKVLNKEFELLLTAETNLTPYYTLVVQFRERIQDKGGLIDYKQNNGKLRVLSREICINKYCYIFSLLYNADQPKELFETDQSRESELEFIMSTVQEKK
jgi:hypothetical protein